MSRRVNCSNQIYCQNTFRADFCYCNGTKILLSLTLLCFTYSVTKSVNCSLFYSMTNANFSLYALKVFVEIVSNHDRRCIKYQGCVLLKHNLYRLQNIFLFVGNRLYCHILTLLFQAKCMCLYLSVLYKRI